MNTPLPRLANINWASIIDTEPPPAVNRSLLRKVGPLFSSRTFSNSSASSCRRTAATASVSTAQLQHLHKLCKHKQRGMPVDTRSPASCASITLALPQKPTQKSHLAADSRGIAHGNCVAGAYAQLAQGPEDQEGIFQQQRPALAGARSSAK